MKSSTLKIQTARVFLPLIEPMRYKGAHGGRGSGKSHFFAEQAIVRFIKHPDTRLVCLREVQRTLKESVKRLIEDKIQSLGVGHYFTILHDRITTPHGGMILFQGMKDHTAESIKSLEGYDVAYVEEAQTFTKRSLEMLRPTIRKDPTPDRPGSELWFSWNPRSASDTVDEFLRSTHPPENSTVVRANWRDNPFFPSVLETERQYDRVHRPGRYAHIWDGEYEPSVKGAIWDRDVLHRGRRDQPPEMARIVVAVDPAVTNNEETSNEHGIIVAGVGQDGRGYMLDDASGHGSPREWATRAVAMVRKWDADAIVAEVNQGGDMVEHTIRTVSPNQRVIQVRATRGKHVRAEPISSLYHLGHVSHVGMFAELEDQLCQITPAGFISDNESESPDRADALVWAFTELFPDLADEKMTMPDLDEMMRGGGAGSWMGS